MPELYKEEGRIRVPVLQAKKTRRDRTLKEGGNLVRKGKREEERDGMSVREKGQ